MLIPKAGSVTILLTPSLRGRVGSRPVVTVYCVPWLSGAPLFGCMLWRKLPRVLVLRTQCSVDSFHGAD